jgi:aerobic-type carbon monoxide dehydrogenase small subunit (CoxS/CutS family)
MPDYVLNVNGARLKVTAPEDESVLSVLRNRLDLTGTKYGCGEGQCAACTVHVDGVPTRSCEMPVGAVANSKITTIEGLEQHGVLTPVQQAFLDEGAFQCGYCTSGMIISAVALLRDNPAPTEADVRSALDGNLCRCGSHQRILKAVLRASAQYEAAGHNPAGSGPAGHELHEEAR